MVRGGRPRGSKNWRDWQGKIFQVVYDKVHGEFKPSVRSVFYDLATMGLLLFKRSDYKGLVKQTSEWRDSGRLEPDCFSDATRWVVEPDNWNPKGYIHSWSPLEYIDSKLDIVRKVPDRYYSNIIHRWDGQPNYIEVWLEKYTMVPVFQGPCNQKKVLLIPNRGFSSKTFAYTNYLRLSQIWQILPGDICIQYYGDDDKSGYDIEKALLNAADNMHYRMKDDITFERIAVTEKQVSELQLPRMDGKVELEGLYNRDKAGFVELIKESIDKRFDPEIYKKMMSEVPTKEEIKDTMIKSIEELLSDLKNGNNY